MALRKRTSVFLNPEHLEGLKALKARDGVPEAESIRRAIAEYLDKRGAANGSSARPSRRAKGGESDR